MFASFINRSALLLCTMLLLVISCATTGAYRQGSFDELHLDGAVLHIPPGKDLLLEGRLRVDLHDSRFRGAARFVVSNRGELRVDFHHSSMMGAYEEDFSLLILSNEIYAFDRKRGRLYRGEQALELLGREPGVKIEKDDILYLLLLKGFEENDMSQHRFLVHGPEWLLIASFKGRDVELGGSKRGIVEFFNQCFESLCYKASYSDYRRLDSAFYPFDLRVSLGNENGRAALKVKEARFIEHDEAQFDLENLLFSRIKWKVGGSRLT